MKKSDFYKVGDRITGLLLLHRETYTNHKRSTRYIAVTTCCGYFRRINVSEIDDRVRRQSKYCGICRQLSKKKLKEVFGEEIVMYPLDWPVPPSSLAHVGHWIWADGGGDE